MNAITKLDTATRMLAEVRTVDEVKDIIDLAEAARIYAKQVDLGLDAQNHAAEIKIRAQRKAGEILTRMNDTGERRTKTDGLSNAKVYQAVTPSTLKEMGIARMDASRWQQIAAVPEDKFEAFIAETKGEDKELTTSATLRVARELHRPVVAPVEVADAHIELRVGDMLSVVPGLGKFDLIIADPPYNVTEWEWDKRGDGFLDEVKEWLSVCKNALAEQYHFFWFCSPKYAADTEMLFRLLGLPVKSRLVWHRRNMAMGSDAKDKFIDSWEMIFHSGNYPLNFPPEWSDNRFDVQTFAVPQTNFTDTKVHPTQKPLELIKNLVTFGSQPGQRVLDPFAGSGTTGAACAGRNCVLVEKEGEYANIIADRLSI